MSAMPYVESRRGGMSPVVKFFIAAVIIFAAFKLVPLTFGNVNVDVAYNEHAALHTEADAIRCSNEVQAVFVNKSCERYNVLKKLDDGRVGDHVLQPCKRFGFARLLEITTYVIGGGSLEEAIAVLTAKGCTQVWP